MRMKYSLRFTPRFGWLCMFEGEAKCEVCGRIFSEGDKCYLLKEKDILVCEECFKEKRDKGAFWDIGAIVPVTIVKNLPEELGDW